MNTTTEALQVAKGISDYGIMIIICAVFLILASGLMIACFRWFRTVITNIMTDYSAQLKTLQETATRNGEAMIDIAEGLIPETQMRVKTISGAFFDMSVEKVCRLIKRIREENHIANEEATKTKIRTLLHNMYEDRNSRFDYFRYRGKKLSEYCNPEWVEWVSKVIEGEIYNEAGINNDRAYTNVKVVYDNIKLDFYHNLNN
ncbi:hypothetical protein [Bacteroides sp.]|uniref:hypothetical protein n=1 Tax=Bacteroides sp. TaxID=29523 RepID=UPI003AB697A8